MTWWKTLEKPEKGKNIAVFRRVDEERDLVVHTTVKKIMFHFPFSSKYVFLSMGEHIYKVKRRRF